MIKVGLNEAFRGDASSDRLAAMERMLAHVCVGDFD
jgi:hypothetical protein